MKYVVFDSIDEIPKADWNSLLGDQHVTHSLAFWQIVQASDLNDFSYRHVLFYDQDNQPAALTSLYTVTTDMAIFAGPRLKSLLQRLRRIFPRLLKLRMLECGTPITLSQPFIARSDVSPQVIVAELDRLIQQTLRDEGQWMVVIRDFEPGSESVQSQFDQCGYALVDGLPNTYLDIRWQTGEQYRAAMKSYFRSKLRKHLRINQQRAIRHELHYDFAHLATQLCEQWQTVFEHAAEYQREMLTPAFYEGLSNDLADQAMVLLFYADQTLVGHAVLLRDGQLLRWLYFGRTEAANDSLYLYVAHAVIETAISLQVERLAMGVTTYPIKRDLGAQMTSMRIALGLRWSFANRLVSWFYPWLNQVPELTNKSVFKE